MALRVFEDVGLSTSAKDVEIWQRCQERELILITDNRNDDSPDSLMAAIRKLNTPASLPVFTIADLRKFSRQQGLWSKVRLRQDRKMPQEEAREAEALDWAEVTVGDVANETR